MKKLLLILVGVGLAVGVLVTAGLVYAQTGDTPETETTEDVQEGTRPMGLSRGTFGGHGFDGFGEGLLEGYMLPALADIFSWTEAQVEGFQVVKDTLQAIRDEFTPEEIHDKMGEALASAVEAALADGAITQEQADQILERYEQMGNREFQGFGGRGMRPDDPRSGFSFPGRDGGLLHEYIEVALAEALGVSVEELQEMKADGLNLRDYADENGLSDEALADLMKEVHTNAIKAALADGAITQEQADMLLEGVETFGPRMPFGPGFENGMHGMRNGGN